MKAINGPFEGKVYITPEHTQKVIDHAVYYDAGFEVTYYRTKNGWVFHSWKNMWNVSGLLDRVIKN